MKKKLSSKEYIYVASMLFGLFFGAGNLIFPVYMGQIGGTAYLAGGRGLPDNRRRPAAAWVWRRSA